MLSSTKVLPGRMGHRVLANTSSRWRTPPNCDDHVANKRTATASVCWRRSIGGVKRYAARMSFQVDNVAAPSSGVKHNSNATGW
jgi:hypothetical protein